MPEYRRANTPGTSYFFTVVTHNRQPILTTDLARHCLRCAWKSTLQKYPFYEDAVVLLPDHLHCVWTLPTDDSNFSSRWKMIKGLFTRSFLQGGGTEGARTPSQQRKREAAVWQRRFWEHRLRDEADLCRHVDYIHFNPVKHGHVSKPIDWRWSSFSRYVEGGQYTPEWGTVEPQDIRDLSTVSE